MEHLWLYYACAATVFWGMNCAFLEKLLEKGFPVSMLMALESCMALPLFLGLSYIRGTAKQGIDMMRDSTEVLYLVVAVSASFLTATYFIFHSIQAKNATLAGLIEVSYPIFTILFTWLFFRQFHLNLYSGIGGLLILGGIAVIYIKG
ncbi:MAG TPA: EamA family transporter [Alphaproteobacteria bacterium]|nr:EamA family transporter [Alphaproteobacteria bacterium]